MDQDDTAPVVRPSKALQNEIDKLLKIKWAGSEGLNAQLIADLTQSAKMIADGLRDLSLRTSVGQSELIPHALELLRDLIGASKRNASRASEGIIEADEQLLRVLGNLVHTHDVNRAKCLRHHAPQIFNDLINLPELDYASLLSPSSPYNSRCLQVLMTVLFNLCFEYAPAHIAYIEAGLVKPISRLVEIIGEKQNQVPLLAVRLLEEVSSTDDAKQMMPAEVVHALLSPIFFIQDPIRTALIEASNIPPLTESLSVASSLLESLSEVSEPIQQIIRTSLVSSSPKINAPSQLIGGPCELWDTSFGRLLCFVRFAELPDDWDSNSSDEEDERPTRMLNRCKASVARCLISAGGQADGDWLVGLLVQWFSEPNLVSSRPDLVTTLGLLLGNMACSDAASARLVQSHSILGPLVSAFRVWTPLSQVPASARPGEQAQVLHSLAGLARNLAVAEENRDAVGASGLVELAIECLREEFDLVQPLLALSLGFLRHVCKGNLRNVLRLTVCGGAERVAEVAKRVDQPHIRLEAARLLASAVCTVGLSRSDGAKCSSVPPPAEDLARASALLGQKAPVKTVVELLWAGATANALLINEALVALAVHATRPDSATWLVQALTEPREIAEGEQGPENAIELVLGCWLGWDRAAEMVSSFSGFHSKVVLADMVRRNAGVLLETLGRTLKKDIEVQGVTDVRLIVGGLDGLVVGAEQGVVDVWNSCGRAA